MRHDARQYPGSRQVAMPIVLGYYSALEFWNLDCRIPNRPHLLGDARARRRDTREARRILAEQVPATPDFQALVDRYGGPLHLIIPDARMRSKKSDALNHVFKDFVHDCAIVRIDEGLYVSVPEFLFLQMASALSIERLILLGFQLCGTYATSAQNDFVPNVFPLTSPEKIIRFLESLPPCKGRRRALRAAKHVLKASASPKESQLAMLLSLPYRLGGYGFAQPSMNHRIDLSVERQMLLRKRFFVCDLYWPKEKVDVEYDSAEFHASKERLVADARRRAALEGLGISSIGITGAQILDPLDFEDLAKTIARIMGRQIKLPANFADASRHLRREIGL